MTIENEKYIDKMQKHHSITKSRLELFIAKNNQFTNVSLMPNLYKKKFTGREYIKIKHFAVPELKRIPFNEAIKNEFVDSYVGASFSPSWSTHWFHIQVTIPGDVVNEQVQFRWNSESEVLIFSKSGEPIQALTGEGGGNQRLEYVLTHKSQGGERFEFYLEMACNGLFGNGNYTIGPPQEKKFKLSMVELAIPNDLVWQLYYDFIIIKDMANKLPEKSSRAERALFVANKIMNVYEQKYDEDNIKQCLKLSKHFLSSKGPVDNHKLIAVGHCHIDTAWLWPYDETKRKVARSWSTQLQLMDQYKQFTFVCSQAQQFEWLQLNYPSLFNKLQHRVIERQFLPIGGTWVEMDCNLPSGEAFCRQFLLGQRYFEQNFGKRCKTFWLPDTFGYSAQLPQIIKLSDMQYFFTQKISWNNINKFPHTTFFWKGLDGTKVLSHMAPGETYNAQVEVEEMLFSETNNKDKMIVNQGLYLFGNGDGGGGPLPSMLEKMNRLKDVEGLPKVQMGNVDQFYDSIMELEEINELPEWDGELYLELHRGTYTSHSIIKKYNRYSEFLLREVELMWTLARIKNNANYPHDKIIELWKLVCLNQFHDVLPGSSINMVYKDAIEFYEKIDKNGNKLIEEAASILLGNNNDDDGFNFMVFNPSAWERSGVIQIPINNNNINAQSNNNHIQLSKGDDTIGYILVNKATPLTLSNSINNLININEDNDDEDKVVLDYLASEGLYKLSNKYILVVINSIGQIISLFDKQNQREVIDSKKYANVIKIYEDIPLFWDAWDVEVYHLEKYVVCKGNAITIKEQGPLIVSILIEYKLTNTSAMKQIIKLTKTSKMVEFDNQVNWSENRKFLKVEFNTNLRSDHAVYETQFGVINRPTHFNTSWDLAKFEVCSHKFASLAETGYGLSIINDSKYGFATHGSTMRLSLIRAPKSPDNECDIGKHRFRFAMYPHKDSFAHADVPKLAHAFNSPLKIHKSINQVNLNFNNNNHHIRLFKLQPSKYDNLNSVILETIKIAEDDNNAIILRMYESAGAHSNPSLLIFINIIDIHLSNILEDDIKPLDFNVVNSNDHKIHSELKLNFTPFQIITLKVRFA